MNEKEIGEIRRRFKQDKSNITHIRGCYVNEVGEIVSQFDQSLGLMTQEETEKFLAILKRTLSGTISKNLLDINFDTQQVAYGEDHKLLMDLRNSAMKNEDAVQTFFQKVIGGVTLEGNYLILLTYDSYDVPFRTKDGDTQADASNEVYSYLLCSICPVKQTKAALSYYVRENEFRSLQADWIVAPPEMGFLFPAFDERSTNLYSALYYTKDSAENHPEFVQALFQQEVPMPAAAQKETFESLLGETLAEECNYETVQAVHEQLCEIIATHKEEKERDPLMMSKGAVRCVLKSCGVSETGVNTFDTTYDNAFGEDMEVSPRNIIDTKRLEICTPDVTIHVSPQRGDLVETRVINGTKYILIRAEDGVEVNGTAVHIT